MSTIPRHLLAIVVLPVTVTMLIPAWIARKYDIHPATPANVVEGLLLTVGVGLLLVGLVLFAACLRWFAGEGRGTLAPWDPPRKLVVRGPYRFVRNPMISGVILILVGEAILLQSVPHALWAAGFVALNLVFIPLLEEPQLEARFGDDYRRYKLHVPRIMPRLRPWSGDESANR